MLFESHTKQINKTRICEGSTKTKQIIKKKKENKNKNKKKNCTICKIPVVVTDTHARDPLHSPAKSASSRLHTNPPRGIYEQKAYLFVIGCSYITIETLLN